METQEQLLQLQSTTQTADNLNSNSQLIEKEIHPGTAFQIVGNKEQGYFVALGYYRITEIHTKEECQRMINEKDYELILGLINASIIISKKDI